MGGAMWMQGVWAFCLEGCDENKKRALRVAFVDNGSCEVQLGKTRVACVVSSSVFEPYHDRPNEGKFSFELVLSPMASGALPKEGWTEQSVEICRVVERSIKGSRAIETESLCILAGSKAWSVRVAIHVLDHCGNLVDAACVAALASLLHFRCPAVTVEEGGLVTFHSDRESAPLAVYHNPVSVTFGFLMAEEQEMAILDPTDEEEDVLEGTMSITVNTQGEICSIQKAGGCAIGVDTLSRCLNVAKVRALEVADTVLHAVHASLASSRAPVKRNLISYLEVGGGENY